MHFEIRALDEATQRIVTTSFEALDEADALGRLRERRLTPLEVRGGSRGALGGALRWLRGIPKGGGAAGSPFSVPLFAQELHALVSAGLNLTESLEAFAEKEKAPARRALIDRLLAALREGQRFSAASVPGSGLPFPLQPNSKKRYLLGVSQALPASLSSPARQRQQADLQ
jgi:general secretion pathway protein F